MSHRITSQHHRDCVHRFLNPKLNVYQSGRAHSSHLVLTISHCPHLVVYHYLDHSSLCNIRAHSRLCSHVCQQCTLCEWPLRELLNENANMGVQNNYFVRKRPFSMGWNGGYGLKNCKTNHTGCPIRIVPFAHVCCDPCECQFGPNSREFGPIFAYGHADLHHNKASPLCNEPSKRTMLAVCGV